MVSSRGRVVIGSLAAAVISLGVFACGDNDESNGRGPDDAPDPEPLFRALEDDLIKTCGGTNGTCHVRGSFQQAPAWLGGPDPYVTVKKYRGVLPATKEVGDSILLTQVRHAGPALADAPNDLYRRVSDWLTAEVPGPPLPNTGAFSVMSGFNSIPLDTVAPGLTNARLTFLATETNGTLTLDALKLVAPDNANVKVDSPFFVILPRSGKVKADPEVNGFKGELTVAAGESVDLFTGKMILLRWDPTGRLKVAFNKIESTPGQGTSAGCTALELFKSSALPAMGKLVDILPDDDQDAGEPLGQGSCIGCHGKAPPANEAPTPAVQAMDLRAAATDPAAACAQAKIWINRQDKAQSTILLNPMGKGNPQHPMKSLAESDSIIVGIKAWVDAEN
ncbi:MAG: hypothetical protein KF764_03945 [Labilithrix sp.]|nr:hypothetical protein [Labilithrix sp.]MBX3222186.1 hypothetical protein [Labilithrix sp.]